MKKGILLFLAALILSLAFTACPGGRRGDTIVIGAKDFTEQFILGYILQALIEEHTDLNTRVVSNLPTWILFQSLSQPGGEVDIYIEYTGTIVGNIFGDTTPRSPDETFRVAREGLRDRYNIRMLDRIGFNNTYTLSVRPDTAQQFNLWTISDLARVSNQLILGGTMEFVNREDGLLGLRRAYGGLEFRSEVTINGVLRYTALMNDEIQVTDAFSTDGMLLRFNLVVLEDDLEFFPAYHAAVLMLEETAQRFPQLVEVSNMLTGVLDDQSMRRLNYLV
ncbi:MAG: glycine/betaine ABC transporter substrate-binding protein, partial [Treponema sp.]|nr:glycine/betaine ABC transporter substrate-binding protein [Treponema sp.]